ncbi:hypothetical protein ACS0ZG_33865 [Burkholderia gladioli]|uniref:hypothetical protein n=1 Tax=Burkholderia gladioli TaxID=28095 RepID=UPI003F7AC1D3
MNDVHALERMSVEAKEVIVIAIDDNDQAWYEMVIPFMLSVRRAGYKGRLGVIGYGLSPEKKRILAAQGIAHYASDAARVHLPYDRFVSAARIFAQEPDVETVALYDADIWFPGECLDIFQQVADDSGLYVAPDVHFCNYVTDPLIGDRREELIQQCQGEVIARCGGALQAGLVVGRRAAWSGFADHVHACMTRIGQDFVPIYGLDTTFLHLWAARGGVRLLGPEQNFLPKWGMRERHDWASGKIVFEFQGAPVRGLHMTGEIRYINRWRYLNRHPEALEQGRPFCLTATGHTTWRLLEPDQASVEICHRAGLAVIHVATDESITTAPLIEASAIAADSICVFVAGSFYADFRVMLNEAVVEVRATYLVDQPSCATVSVEVNGTVVYEAPPSCRVSVPVKGGDMLRLRSNCLPGQHAQTLWTLDVRAVSNMSSDDQGDHKDVGEEERPRPI